MAEASKRARRSLGTVAARTALGLLLTGQLAALWILARPTPTRLPSAVVETLADLVSGQLRVECREASVDRRGRIRLGGARIFDSLNPADGFSGDIDILPDWRGLCLGSARILAAQARGQVSLGGAESGARVDDLVVRLVGNRDTVELQAGARVGLMVLRADLVSRRDAEPGALPAAAGPDAAAWDRGATVLALRALRAMQGAAGLTATSGRVAIDGGFVENPAAVNPLPLAARSGRLRGGWDGKLRAELSLENLRGPDLGATRAWVSVDETLAIQALVEGIRFDGLGPARASVRGAWRPGATTRLNLLAETAESRASAQLEIAPASVRVRDLAARLSAQDIAGVAPLAQAARASGIDLCGTVELIGGEASWEEGELRSTRATFALAESGWRDLRPALVRPEQPRPVFRGDLSLDLGGNRLSLTRLDLAGIRGEIEGGLRAGDPFSIRLASSEGQPVNPSCLNALLGQWWVELWARFDLSTHGAKPHADVRVEGRWGEVDSIRTTVRAHLDRFGFMNARFLSTDLWVFAEPESTLVRVDNLRGELEGRDAGAAHGTIRWNWRRAEWRGEPQIDFEGDLHPACALRLHDPAAAAQLKDWSFGQPLIHVSLGPDRPLHVRLQSPGESVIGGVKVDQLALTASQPSPAERTLCIEAAGNLSGGRAAVVIKGDLASHNHIQLSVREWSRSGVETLVAQLRGTPQPQTKSDPSQLTLLYEGSCDFTAPWSTQGNGRATLVDPSLKTVHLLGLLSEGFDALGIGFSNYPLNRADVTFSCAGGQAEVKPLTIDGEDAALKLKGFINLQNGGLNLQGQLYLKDSPWGPLKYINPNRLIAKMISVKVGGSVNKPEVQAKIGNTEGIK